ncbi:hypothetical protein [Spirillospora sp. NPDC047279]|uniref:hypothetical protein n=1 Tax=Spirillospora sp. NPDC047279 TaxID=3155478 RepID=UPI00340D38F0
MILRPLLAALVAMIALAPPALAEPYPPGADKRLTRVTTALARDPLFVDPDLSFTLNGADRARVKTAMATTSQALGTPVFVILIPNPQESETQGRGDALLHALHERLGRDGLYLMADSRARFEVEGFNVPRRVSYADIDYQRDSQNPFNGLTVRLIARLDGVRISEQRRPVQPRLYSTPEAFGKEVELRPEKAEEGGPFLLGLLLVGPLGATVLYWLGRGALGLRPSRRRKRNTTPRKLTRPSLRRLRHLAATELSGLGDELPGADEDNPGHTYAASAYDAAKILHDEAGDKHLDLVGVIVLARQGRAALADRDPEPAAPCFVNPLHGASTVRRKTGLVPERRPICDFCAKLKPAELRGWALRVPVGSKGPQPHYTVPGVWRDTAFGGTGKNLVPRVLEYLGVD